MRGGNPAGTIGRKRSGNALGDPGFALVNVIRTRCGRITGRAPPARGTAPFATQPARWHSATGSRYRGTRPAPRSEPANRPDDYPASKADTVSGFKAESAPIRSTLNKAETDTGEQDTKTVHVERPTVLVLLDTGRNLSAVLDIDSAANRSHRGTAALCQAIS